MEGCITCLNGSGGSLFYLKAGGDCSQPFDSYHCLSARCGLGYSTPPDASLYRLEMGFLDGVPSVESSTCMVGHGILGRSV